MCGDCRRRYDDGFRRVAVSLFREGLGYKSVARRLDMPVGTAKQWGLLYGSGGEAALMGERGGRKVYDYETKLSAVLDHVEHGLTKAEVMARYGIASLAPLERWCREYRAGGPDALRPRPKGRPKGARSKPKPAPDRERALEEENAYLRAKVAYLEKVDALLASKSPTGRNR